jgi:hypothetical protein
VTDHAIASPAPPTLAAIAEAWRTTLATMDAALAAVGHLAQQLYSLSASLPGSPIEAIPAAKRLEAVAAVSQTLATDSARYRASLQALAEQYDLALISHALRQEERP